MLLCNGKAVHGMETKTLLKANIKQHKGSLAGIFILMLLVAAALGTVLTVWSNSGRYIQNEMQRAGFGELTAWISGVPDTETLIDSIQSLSEIDRAQAQPLIYAN